jgi:hypothetical protein
MYASTWKDWKGINHTFKEHTFCTRSRNAVMTLGDHGEQHRLHQITPQQQQIYSLYIKEGELHGERHAKRLFLVLYSAFEKQRKHKYMKIFAGSAQNSDFLYSKKWSFALLLLTNPLPLTTIHNIAMGVVAIGVLLSFPGKVRPVNYRNARK